MTKSVKIKDNLFVNIFPVEIPKTLEKAVIEEEANGGLLQLVFADGKMYNETKLFEIRNRLLGQVLI